MAVIFKAHFQENKITGATAARLSWR